jgi:RNA polymerase sigma-70 factor (ECF subfamily)
MLTRSHGFSSPGRFQYEAAIQSAHCARPVDRAALRRLHRALVRIAPTLGAVVALAALDGEIDGPRAGLRSLDAIDDPAVTRFQPAWVTRAHLLSRAGRTDDAVRAYRRAIELTPQAEVASYLRHTLDGLT